MQNKDPSRLNEIKTMFKASAVKDNGDFLSLLADIGAIAIQYGMRDDFCNLLMANNSSLQGYADFAQNLYTRWNISALDLVPQSALSVDPKDYRSLYGMRQWLYQSCTEYGYWQNANTDPNKSTRSSLLNADYFQNICFRLFGIKERVNTDHINNHFYQPLLNQSVTNIFFTNGSNDPWSTLSMTQANRNTTNPNLSYYLIEGAAHCEDLRMPKTQDSSSLKTARAQFISLIESWQKKG